MGELQAQESAEPQRKVRLAEFRTVERAMLVHAKVLWKHREKVSH
jgi:hypothetical protein